ncbi:MAG: cytochrome c biogenesis protein ResB, partial [Candidatus Adiutrix sp.]|nr:cytochrome c biogenesis protein ResB [Candidatus Adiutrix sp.]
SGLVVVRRLRSPKKKTVFVLNHAGLWLFLAAAGLGAADREQYIMHVPEGEVEWRVYDDDQRMLELPVAIRLDDFDLQEYPPKLAVIDRKSGLPQPEGKPFFFQLADGKAEWRFGAWTIGVEEYIAQAAPSGGGVYSELPMPGAGPAARIFARHKISKEIRAGWVSGGSRVLPVSSLLLNDNLVLVMARPEPQRFISKLKAFTQDGREKEATVEVNKPLQIGNWLIYQYGYDNQAGRMSTYSSFELVSDPWLYFVRAGLVLWALGSAGLIYQGKRGQKS